MPQVKRILTCVGLLWLLLLVAFAACNESTDGEAGPGTVDTPLAESQAIIINGEVISTVVNADISDRMGAVRDVTAGTLCSGASDASCVRRDVSHFNLFTMYPVGAAYTSDLSAHSVEVVLEKGLWLSEMSPVHLAVRGTAAANSTRCEWRGVARTAAQRETAIRFWLGIADSDSLPSAAEVERRFMEELDQYALALPQTAKTSFKVLAQGGLPPFVMPC